MEEKDYSAIKLENQLCFPLYACAKEIVRRYTPYLDELDLTYTQYIAMMVLWDRKKVTVSEIGKELFLDSGTLTPLLKKLEQKGYVTRTRMPNDERNVCVAITDTGDALKEKAVNIPEKMQGCFSLEPEEAANLYKTLHKMLNEL